MDCLVGEIVRGWRWIGRRDGRGRICEGRVRWEIRWNRDLIRRAPRERSGEVDVVKGFGAQLCLFGSELRDGRVDWPLGYLWLDDAAAGLSFTGIHYSRGCLKSCRGTATGGYGVVCPR